MLDGDISERKLLDILGICKYIFCGIGLFFTILYLLAAINVEFFKLPLEHNYTHVMMGFKLASASFFDLVLGYLFRNAYKSFDRWIVLIVFVSFDLIFSLIELFKLLNVSTVIALIINVILLACVLRIKKDVVVEE